MHFIWSLPKSPRFWATRLPTMLRIGGIVTLWSTAAMAVSDREVASAAFARGEEASRSLRFKEARDAYAEALSRDPSAPFALTAHSRLAELDTHAEGEFVPLTRIEALRRDPKKLNDPRILEALEREVGDFPEGRVRSEARLMVAEAWTQLLAAPNRAKGNLEAILDDRSADRTIRAVALSELVTILRGEGNLRRASSLLDRNPTLSPSLTAEVRRLDRRVLIRWCADGLLAGLGLLGLGSTVTLLFRFRDVDRVKKCVVCPLALATALYIGAAGAVIARLHGGADARPFVFLGLLLVLLDMVARAVRAAWLVERNILIRSGWTMFCIVGVLSGAFVVIDQVDVGYLEGFGL